MNKIILIGNLTRDPELRTIPSGVSVCDFTIAVNRRGPRNQQADGQQEQTDFFRITAWRQLGENCAKYLAKGRKVYVSGPLSARTYQANDGTTRVSLEVTAEDVEFLSSRNEGGAPAGFAAPAAPAPTAQNNGFMAVDNDELPF
ncbi:MAG: single-stranded DNA-binding protein [Clostridia bacterium]|nr:single-stranded DNA-binding protein [Clostridia bacterium]